MVERSIYSVDDALQFIFQILDERKMSIARTEKTLGFSTGLISKWKNSKFGPSIFHILELFNHLNLEVVFRDLNVDLDEVTVEDSSKSAIDEDILECAKQILSYDVATKKLILDLLTTVILLKRN